MSLRTLVASVFVAWGLTHTPAALAQTSESGDAQGEDLWALLETLPARQAWDIGAAVSFGNIGYWQDLTNPWVGFGVRGTYGWMIGAKNRLGPSFGLSIEGPFPVYMTTAFEPMLAWDRVGGNVLVGASVGPSLLIHSSQATVRTETDVMLAPMVAVRVGYSKPFSRLGRRFYVVAEPKARWLSGGRNLNPQLDWGAVLLVGSGRGR